MPLNTNEPFNDWETSVVKASVTPTDPAHSTVKQYSIIIKRNDKAYRWFEALNTATLIAGVLLVAGIFGMVAYIICDLSNVSTVVQQIQHQRP